jgi:hypothetical protein
MRTLGIDGELDPGVLDGVDVPTAGEARFDLCPADSSRAPIAGLLITETRQEVASAGCDDRRQVDFSP